MRKIIAILVAMAMAAVFAPMIGAGPTDIIEVTLNPSSTAAITVDQTEWLPVCGLGGTNSTALDWATITNTGDVNVSVTIDGENTENWAIGDYSEAPGHNQFQIGVPAGCEAPEIILTASPQAWLSDLPTDAGDATLTFGLTAYMPSTSSTNTAQHMTITFEATVK